MASIEFIQKRITGAETKLEKLNKKLERINKAKATNWEVNPYYYSEYDLKYTIRDIEEAQEVLEGYKAQLVTATEKANSRNVKIIIDFLEMWKTRVRQYYMVGLEAYYRDEAAVRTAYSKYNTLPYGTPEYFEAKAIYEEMSKEHHNDCYGVWEKKEFTNRWGKKDYTKVKVEEGKYEYLRPYSDARIIEDAVAKLEKDLVLEAERKYDFIIERTNAIVGQITDASNLAIGDKDDLNGYIIGTKGIAKVQTIGAGGYNIQCFHFRTLINKMK